MHVYLIFTLVFLGAILLMDLLMTIGIDDKDPAKSMALVMAILHFIPLAMAIVACALSLAYT